MTLQPLQALQHPAFQEMIHVASHATNGVKIDNLRNTREGILREFKHNVTVLSKRLNVSSFLACRLSILTGVLTTISE